MSHTVGSLSVVTVVGARPNFVKLAALHAAVMKHREIRHIVVHTGQHYDPSLSEAFFRDLKIPHPDHHLGVGSGSHADQVARTMVALEPVLASLRPGWTLVVGDVNATIATALCSKKLGLRLGHVEAGLRSFDWSMPEEINRVVTDRLSDALFVSEQSGARNLRAEGVDESRIVFVGNVMIDTLNAHMPVIRTRHVTQQLGHSAGQYGVVTLHRPSNTDDRSRFLGWMRSLERLAVRMPLVFPMHPRAQERLKSIGFRQSVERLQILDPLSYFDMLALLKDARLVLTDSGGIQEETTALGVPCFTLRDNTERPATVYEGTNQLLGSDPHSLDRLEIPAAAAGVEHRRPAGWDGAAAERIAGFLLAHRDLPLRQK